MTQSKNRSRYRARRRIVLAGFNLLMALATVASATAGDHRSTVAILVNDMGNPYFSALAGSVRETARRELGAETRILVQSSGYDLARQRRQLQELHSEPLDLLVITGADPHALRPEIMSLREAGVVVVAVDVETAGAQLTVTTDNQAAGYQACQHLAHYLDGRGQIVILDGPAVSSIGERLNGCEQALAPFPDIRIVDRENSGASYVGGVEAMTRLLARQSELDGVFSINDPATEGAAAAIRFAERESVRIASVDGSPAVVRALQQGDSVILNTAAQFPWRMGEQAVMAGLEWLEAAMERRETDPLLIPVTLITQDNAELYCDWRLCDEAPGQPN